MFDGLRDSWVSRERMIVKDAGDEKAKIEGVWDVDRTIAEEEAVWIKFEAMFGSGRRL